MQETVDRLALDHENVRTGLKVLNVGFGLGIVSTLPLLYKTLSRYPCPQIDSMFQALPTKPAQHVIIEAHPDVLKHMRQSGWYEKPGVKILQGKWQNLVDSEELIAVGGFDIIYTDTFSEDYKGTGGCLPSVIFL